MNSKEISSNSSENNSEIKKENQIKEMIRKHRILIGCAIIGVACIVIALVIYSNNSRRIQRLQGEYNAAIESYNAAIAEYNSEVERIDSLQAYIEQISDSELPQKADKKQKVSADFETYYANGADISIILQEASQCISDKDSLCAQYNEICVNEYNTMVHSYNEDANRYNSLLEKMAAYNVGDIPDAIVLLEEVKMDNKAILEKWHTLHNFADDVDTVLSQRGDINQKYYDVCLVSYNSVIEDYNIVATEYNDLVTRTSVNFIDGMTNKASVKDEMDIESMKNMSEGELCDSLDSMLSEIEVLVGDYLIALQITNPEQQWVLDKLKKVKDITEVEAVTKSKDPNGLLGKEGGYTACIYFTVKGIDSSKIKGSSVVDKGTDAGGAIEVYETLEYALNRCDYLSQFDGTVLYSGSYVIIGTMVVRTSYKLSNSQQIDLTNDITKEFTNIN